jgi:hypothetical protein
MAENARTTWHSLARCAPEKAICLQISLVERVFSPRAEESVRFTPAGEHSPIHRLLCNWRPRLQAVPTGMGNLAVGVAVVLVIGGALYIHLS